MFGARVMFSLGGLKRREEKRRKREREREEELDKQPFREPGSPTRKRRSVPSAEMSTDVSIDKGHSFVS